MGGNVWEWVSDWYASEYDAADTDNPIGPATGTSRVLRGGSWINTDANTLRAAYRDFIDPTDLYSGVGFRCASTWLFAP